MCGRFTEPGDIEIIRGFKSRYGLDVNTDPGDAGPPTREERIIAPFNDVNAVYTDREGVIRLGSMYWQLIQPWNRYFESGYTCFNVRKESLSRRHNEPLLRRHRCILPVRSFFETRKVGGKPVKPREAYEFVLRDSGLMALGGIYSVWVNPADRDDRRYSCSIITMEPNEIVGEVHDRMPFVLPGEDVSRWLDASLNDFDEIMSMIRPVASESLQRTRE
ncbi:MAG: SOS response-associated peptidase [Thermoleophilia bacterium]